MPQQVIIHCKPSLREFLHQSNLSFEYTCNELNVIVDDVPYTVTEGYYQDPDEQLCEHYGINYDLVNCIEAV